MIQIGNSGAKTSSFWLDPIYFKGSDNKSKEERESGDILKLASVRRSIGNFVSIVTGKNIPVEFATVGNSATDGKKVIISADLKKFDTVCGLALHEGSHIKLSNFKVLEQMRDNPGSFFKSTWLNEMATKYSMSRYDIEKLMINRLKSLTNWLEDRRIDNYIYTNAPGYQGYYESMYDEYWNSNEISKGLKSSMFRDEVWESYEFRLINLTSKYTDLNALKGLIGLSKLANLKNVARFNNTKEVVEVATEMLVLIESYTKPNPIQNKEEGEGEEGESKESKEGEGTSSPQTSEGNTKDGDESGKEEEQDGDESGSDSKNKNEKSGNDKDDVDGESDNTPSSNDPNRRGDKTSDNGTPQDPPKKLTDEDIEKVIKAIENQKKFMNNEIEKKGISDEKQNMMKAMEESGTEQKQVAKGIKGLDNSIGSAKCIVIKKFNERLLKSDPFGIFLKRPDFINEVNEGLKLGNMLGRKLQIRNEERTLKTSRLRTGKIDDRLIHSLGYGAEQVFERTFTDTFNPLHVHISIDASGSMSGRKWVQTMISSVAIAKAASMVSNLDVVISFRYTGYTSGRNHWNNHFPIVLVGYDSKVDDITKIKKLFPYLDANSATPEGLCVEGIMDIMVEGNKTNDSYFINFSDGQPYFSNREIVYSGDPAYNHTKKMMDMMRTRGIKILSYYIGGGYDDMNTFKKMYGKDSENIDVTSLVPLAKTLNKLFTQK